MRKNRLEALVDGIFAIAMTILVLGIDTPTGTISASKMDAYIMGLAPDVYSYCLSFLLLGVFCGLTTCTSRNWRRLTQDSYG
jgi:uncharacterized membrane protein